ncbi:MAG: phosphodiesterase, partial [Chloroflexota bacterium]
QGREPQGIVEPHQVEEVRRRVIAALETLRDPQTGRPLLERVIPGEEAAQGPYAHLGPDLHVVLDGYRCIAFPLFAMDGKIITQQIRGDSGCHRREGIVLAWGPGVRPGVALRGARIVDLAPTILWLMGLPVPDHMDGRPLVEAFAEARAVNWSLSSGTQLGELSRLTAEEEAEVEARLRSLGYLG